MFGIFFKRQVVHKTGIIFNNTFLQLLYLFALRIIAYSAAKHTYNHKQQNNFYFIDTQHFFKKIVKIKVMVLHNCTKLKYV